MLDFLGIGAQKSGTTWLYEMLARHPQVAFPAGKEAHFWNNPGRDRAHYLGLFEAGPDGIRRGEITPAYSLLDEDTIRAIHAVNPQLRILFSMRNPLHRAWSSALMALRRAELSVQEASDQWFLDHFRSAGSTGRGDYEGTLRRWRAVFPAEQILVLDYDGIRDAPDCLLRDCARHLGIDEACFAGMGSDTLGRRVFAGPGHMLPPRLHDALVELYAPRIRSLSRYLGLDLRHWLDEGYRQEPAANDPRLAGPARSGLSAIATPAAVARRAQSH